MFSLLQLHISMHSCLGNKCIRKLKQDFSQCPSTMGSQMLLDYNSYFLSLAKMVGEYGSCSLLACGDTRMKNTGLRQATLDQRLSEQGLIMLLCQNCQVHCCAKANPHLKLFLKADRQHNTHILPKHNYIKPKLPLPYAHPVSH